MTTREQIDGHTIWVAIGVGSGLGKVKTKKVTFEWLKDRLGDAAEDKSLTFEQYLALAEKAKKGDKEANDRILVAKRIAGNWTAAKYKGSSRKVADVIGKSCIVLDLDYVTHEQLEYIRDGFAEVNAFAWFMHTSRSHTPEKPRVRLVIPCSRLMQPEEAYALHRLVALLLADDPDEAIEIPDLVSFRTNQTMFFPSISIGQEFWTDENVAPVFDVDDFLEAHPEWTNIQALPFQERESHAGLKDPNRKMEDPREKMEPIGAFCRAFTVEDVIEKWLSEIYIPGDSETETRYTYAPGSASNGAVVYDDGLFLHSNHGTDPIEGSANAWDLARIHLFGRLDEKAHGNTGPANLPSYKAMAEFAHKRPEVMAELYSGHDDILDDLEDDDDEDEAEDRDDLDDEVADLLGDELDDLPDDGGEPEKKNDAEWMTQFRRKASGDLEVCQTNISLICANDPRFAKSIGFNDFTLEPVCFKPIKSKKIGTASRPLRKHERKHGRLWADSDDMSINEITSALRERGGYETDFPRHMIEAAVLNAGQQNPVHPVKDFLEDCHRKWLARKPNYSLLDRIPQEFHGCPDTPFHRESSRMLCIQAVARIMEPGCKVDTMTILQGPTGSRKSTFWEVFFGGFFTELKADLDKVDRVIENIRGHWAVEMAEMQAAKKADSNTLKSMLSSAADVHRLAYARREMKFPRQSVFVGTSNEDDYLSDPTSSRRYWVWITVRTMFDPIDIDRLKDSLWLIWGEAYQAYLDLRAAQPHGDLWLDLQNPEAMRERDRIAEKHRKRTAVEEIADVIEEWLESPQRACDVMLDEDGLTVAAYEGDESLVVRNMVSAKDAFTVLRHEEVLAPYRNADVRTYGKALARVPGWRDIGKVRRHGSKQQVWFVKGEDGPMWVPAGVDAGALAEPDDDDLDDLLG